MTNESKVVGDQSVPPAEASFEGVSSGENSAGEITATPERPDTTKSSFLDLSFVKTSLFNWGSNDEKTSDGVQTPNGKQARSVQEILDGTDLAAVRKVTTSIRKRNLVWQRKHRKKQGKQGPGTAVSADAYSSSSRNKKTDENTSSKNKYSDETDANGVRIKKDDPANDKENPEKLDFSILSYLSGGDPSANQRLIPKEDLKKKDPNDEYESDVDIYGPPPTENDFTYVDDIEIQKNLAYTLARGVSQDYDKTSEGSKKSAKLTRLAAELETNYMVNGQVEDRLSEQPMRIVKRERHDGNLGVRNVTDARGGYELRGFGYEQFTALTSEMIEKFLTKTDKNDKTFQEIRNDWYEHLDRIPVDASSPGAALFKTPMQNPGGRNIIVAVEVSILGSTTLLQIDSGSGDMWVAAERSKRDRARGEVLKAQAKAKRKQLLKLLQAKSVNAKKALAVAIPDHAKPAEEGQHSTFVEKGHDPSQQMRASIHGIATHHDGSSNGEVTHRDGGHDASYHRSFLETKLETPNDQKAVATDGLLQDVTDAEEIDPNLLNDEVDPEVVLNDKDVKRIVDDPLESAQNDNDLLDMYGRLSNFDGTSPQVMSAFMQQEFERMEVRKQKMSEQQQEGEQESERGGWMHRINHHMAEWLPFSLTREVDYYNIHDMPSSDGYFTKLLEKYTSSNHVSYSGYGGHSYSIMRDARQFGNITMNYALSDLESGAAYHITPKRMEAAIKCDSSYDTREVDPDKKSKPTCIKMFWIDEWDSLQLIYPNPYPSSRPLEETFFRFPNRLAGLPQVEQRYAQGSAAGPVGVTTIQFAGFAIPNAVITFAVSDVEEFYDLGCSGIVGIQYINTEKWIQFYRTGTRANLSVPQPRQWHRAILYNLDQRLRRKIGLEYVRRGNIVRWDMDQNREIVVTEDYFLGLFDITRQTKGANGFLEKNKESFSQPRRESSSMTDLLGSESFLGQGNGKDSRQQKGIEKPTSEHFDMNLPNASILSRSTIIDGEVLKIPLHHVNKRKKSSGGTNASSFIQKGDWNSIDWDEYIDEEDYAEQIRELTHLLDTHAQAQLAHEKMQTEDDRVSADEKWVRQNLKEREEHERYLARLARQSSTSSGFKSASFLEKDGSTLLEREGTKEGMQSDDILTCSGRYNTWNPVYCPGNSLDSNSIFEVNDFNNYVSDSYYDNMYVKGTNFGGEGQKPTGMPDSVPKVAAGSILSPVSKVNSQTIPAMDKAVKKFINLRMLIDADNHRLAYVVSAPYEDRPGHLYIGTLDAILLNTQIAQDQYANVDGAQYDSMIIGGKDAKRIESHFYHGTHSHELPEDYKEGFFQQNYLSNPQLYDLDTGKETKASLEAKGFDEYNNPFIHWQTLQEEEVQRRTVAKYTIPGDDTRTMGGYKFYNRRERFNQMYPELPQKWSSKRGKNVCRHLRKETNNVAIGASPTNDNVNRAGHYMNNFLDLDDINVNPRDIAPGYRADHFAYANFIPVACPEPGHGVTWEIRIEDYWITINNKSSFEDHGGGGNSGSGAVHKITGMGRNMQMLGGQKAARSNNFNGPSYIMRDKNTGVEKEYPQHAMIYNIDDDLDQVMLGKVKPNEIDLKLEDNTKIFDNDGKSTSWFSAMEVDVRSGKTFLGTNIWLEPGQWKEIQRPSFIRDKPVGYFLTHIHLDPRSITTGGCDLRLFYDEILSAPDPIQFAKTNYYDHTQERCYNTGLFGVGGNIDRAAESRINTLKEWIPKIIKPIRDQMKVPTVTATLDTGATMFIVHTPVFDNILRAVLAMNPTMDGNPDMVKVFKDLDGAKLNRYRAKRFMSRNFCKNTNMPGPVLYFVIHGNTYSLDKSDYCWDVKGGLLTKPRFGIDMWDSSEPQVPFDQKSAWLMGLTFHRKYQPIFDFTTPRVLFPKTDHNGNILGGQKRIDRRSPGFWGCGWEDCFGDGISATGTIFGIVIILFIIGIIISGRENKKRRGRRREEVEADDVV